MSPLQSRSIKGFSIRKRKRKSLGEIANNKDALNWEVLVRLCSGLERACSCHKPIALCQNRHGGKAAYGGDQVHRAGCLGVLPIDLCHLGNGGRCRGGAGKKRDKQNDVSFRKPGCSMRDREQGQNQQGTNQQTKPGYQIDPDRSKDRGKAAAGKEDTHYDHPQRGHQIPDGGESV